MIDLLHRAARDEAAGQDVAARVAKLLNDGADPHQTDEKGETAFNIAAANSPVTGRLMTLHWFRLALEGRGAKGLNDRSGSHGSTLAQYMAKWLHDEELETAVAAGTALGMKIDVPNAGGWTPLTAAAAMGRVRAVEIFVSRYSGQALLEITTEEYRAKYNGHPVIYPAGITAGQAAQERLAQDESLTALQHADLKKCVALISDRG